MRNLKSILVVVFVSLVITSCEKNNEPDLAPVESKTATNIHAPVTTDYTVSPPATSGEFTKFSFKTGTVVTDNSWDIAFRGTSILVNGGTQIGGLIDEPIRAGEAALSIETGTFTSVLEAPVDTNFKQDASSVYALTTGSGNGWYTYAGPPTHLINPIAGKVIVVKTNDGHYAKMEILSYYKDLDTSSDSRYYTFNYIYNPNIGEKSFE
ncbi:MAG: HmuY family protein [Polaribacter sp.]|uniref:HmuY family protein n=1 Tax=Polaribacter sp. TaxID=1920175 RepID=UPI002F356AD0